MSLLNLSYLILIVLSITACSSPRVIEYSGSADPDTEINRLQADINDNISSQGDVLAPDNFRHAYKNFEDAKKARRENKSASEVLHEVAVSQSYLDKAVDFTRKAEEVIPSIVEDRRNAILSGAPRIFPVEFDSTDSALIHVTEGIEDGDNLVAESAKVDFQNRYRRLELKAIQSMQLGAARATLREAKNEGAERLNPRTYAFAQKRIADAEILIEANRHNPEEIDRIAAGATDSAMRVLSLQRQVKSSSNLNREQVAAQLAKDRMEAARIEAAYADQLVNPFRNKSKEE